MTNEIDLETMVLTCPVHIHTPRAYIDTIHGSHPSQSVNGLDLFRSLAALTRRPLDFHAIYSQLSQQVKAEIEVAFIHRIGRSIPSPHCAIYIFFLPLRRLSLCTIYGDLYDDVFVTILFLVYFLWAASCADLVQGRPLVLE